eukprot:TRINITY_DN570_c0_g1_i3.p2 TRINITY_DN570_c0_g1~~TRINITY_DN570_c0_g1_i3.p2  ORF type:complete len:139 (-),score=20.94 TRINITY_DN570_c0_g1_i3:51-467(-)
MLYLLSYKLRLNWLVPFKHELFGIPYSTNGFGNLFPQPLKIITPGLIQSLHSRGRKIFIFGHDMDREEFIMDALNMKVDGIFSDSPDLLMKCIKKYKSQDYDQSQYGNIVYPVLNVRHLFSFLWDKLKEIKTHQSKQK